MPSYYEFFAGGGMARAGLGPDWSCAFANDIDEKKGAAYKANWGAEHLKIADVASLTTDILPGQADLAWASFPCQDLSLAGAGAGLEGHRSGTFWPFWKLVCDLNGENRAPKVVVLENVAGALSSHEGRDFAAIASAMTIAGYRLGALLIDAVHFVPQSRPRLFIVAVRNEFEIATTLYAGNPDPFWHPEHLRMGYERLAKRAKASWIWWTLPVPPPRTAVFSDLIEEEPSGVVWHTKDETRRLLSLMSPLNRKKVERARRCGGRVVGGVYRRTRKDETGNRVQRAEVRFDDISGCLRTPAGGSSRQTILIVDGSIIRSRLLSPREAARLMGLPDSYRLPPKYNDAYHLAGDGVVIPVVRFLTEHILNPVIRPLDLRSTIAA